MKRKRVLRLVGMSVLASGLLFILVQILSLPDHPILTVVVSILFTPLYLAHIPAVVLANLTHWAPPETEKLLTWAIYLSLIALIALHKRLGAEVKKSLMIWIVGYIVLLVVLERTLSIPLNLTLSPYSMTNF